ncbi:MAG: hypothetical protein KAS07_05705, partial [Candidatus Pacebacteria bacterium]|nr:hypothetical protein [Candidatus Paceibacterota bacterium]
MKCPIQNEIEYFVAQAQAETDIAQHLLEETRKEESYWEEKAAAKMAAFHKHEEKMITLYAELKSYHPELAGALEDRKPYLLELLENARQSY